MIRVSHLVFAGVLFTGGVAYAQSQPGTQADASAGTGTSAAASRENGVQAGNGSSSGAAVQHNGTQAAASDAGNTSVSANKSGAQASSSSTHASSAKNSHGSANSGADSTLNAALSRPVDAKKNKPGDPVAARTTRAAKSPDGTPLPKGTELMGHVTQAQPRTKNDAESQLGIVFDKAVLKDGREVPMNATVQALAAGQSAASATADNDTAGLGAGSMAGGSGSAPRGLAGGGALGAVGATGGAVGGATSSVGGATSSAGNVAGSAGATVGSTAGAATSVSHGAVGGLNGAGQLMSNSEGVFNMEGLSLASSSAGEGSVITSATKDVHLDSGTQLLLGVASNASAPAAH